MTYGIYLHLKPSERHGREVGWDGLGVLGAGDVAKSAPQKALGWRAGLDAGPVTRLLRALIWAC